jgi:hypothetical protein
LGRNNLVGIDVISDYVNGAGQYFGHNLTRKPISPQRHRELNAGIAVNAVNLVAGVPGAPGDPGVWFFVSLWLIYLHPLGVLSSKIHADP